MHTNKTGSAGDERSQLKLQSILMARLNSKRNSNQSNKQRTTPSLSITFVSRKEIKNWSKKSRRFCSKAPLNNF